MARRSDYRTPETIQRMAIDAAEFIISRRGLDQVNARSIAKKMGYAPGTIYVVFKNLQELKLHVNARTLQRLTQVLIDSLVKCRTTETCIKNMSLAYYQFALDNQALWTLLFSIYPAGTVLPKWYQQKIEYIFSLVEQQLTPLLTRKTTRVLAARTLWSGVHGICALALNDKLALANVKSAHNLINSLITNYLTGIHWAQQK